MRLPDSAHNTRTWRIHEITPDFRLEDVWALPTPGGPGDFPRLVDGFTSDDPGRASPRLARTLWATRWRIGELLGWDDPETGAGSGVPTLYDRLPADLRESRGPDFEALPFTSLYLLDDEWAAEIANQTVHGVMHVGWVTEETGGYRGQMAVLVKPNGWFGAAYMAAIRPFRYLIVYPAIMRRIELNWRKNDPPGAHRWALLYDADCDFCKWLVANLLRWDRAARLHPMALQRRDAGDLLADLTPAERMASWHLVSPTSMRRSGGDAFPPLLRLLPRGRLPAAAFARFPGLTERGYRWVAEHRSQLSKILPARAKRRASERVGRRERALDQAPLRGFEPRFPD